MYRCIVIDYVQDSTRNRTRTSHKSSQDCNHTQLLTLQLEEDLTRHQKEEQEGTALQTFSDSNLFFVDKVAGLHVLLLLQAHTLYITLLMVLLTLAGW